MYTLNVVGVKLLDYYWDHILSWLRRVGTSCVFGVELCAQGRVYKSRRTWGETSLLIWCLLTLLSGCFVVVCVWCVMCVGGCVTLLSAWLKSSDKSLPSADRKTSLLSCLQDSVKYKSSISDLSFSVPKKRLDVVLGRSLSLRVNTENGEYRRFPA